MAKKPVKKRKKTVRNEAKAPRKRPSRRSAEPTRDDDRYDEEPYGDEFYDEFAEESYGRGYEEPRRDRRNQRHSRPVRDDEDYYEEFSDEDNTFYTDEMNDRDRDYPDDRDERAPRKNRKKTRKPAKGKRGGNSRGGKKPVESRNRKAAKRPKKEKQRKPMSPTRRRIIHIISYVAIIAVVLIVGVILSLTVLFKTQAYEVTGITKYTEDEIIDASGIKIGDNIFLAPKRPAEKRIKDKYPYVEEVDVSFKIPDTIRISVEEAVEGYLIKVSDTEYLVISTKGRILNRITDASEYDLPIFIGPTLTSGEIGDYVSYEDDKVVSMIESITQTFADNGYQGITEIDATDMADISFTYDNRIKVKLGIPEDLDYKIRTAMIIINDKIDSGTAVKVSGVLDVSRCNSTKRSYFDEATPTVNPSEKPTESESGSSSGSDSSGQAENNGEWSEGGYVSEDEYSYYEYGGGYTADDAYAYYDAVGGEW